MRQIWVSLCTVGVVLAACEPTPGSVTRPLAASYSKRYLNTRGYVNPTAGEIKVPVFGLYDGYSNTVNLKYVFSDGSSKTTSTSIVTEVYSDPCGYKSKVILQPRTTSTALSYDFILVVSECSTNTPTVVDTDGIVRWVGTAGVNKEIAGFYANAVYVADRGLVRNELDGTVTRVDDLAALAAVDLHHSVDKGKPGMIIDLDTTEWVESVNAEIDRTGKVLKKWFLGDIISQAMIAGGDDPTPFVRMAKGRYDFNAYEDWFHNNSVAYRASDDSLIISSRENFVICLDYETSAIKWILGDQSKQWYQYPSLKKYALNLAAGSLPPIGQHAVSITKDDDLLLFDNGQGSQNHIPQGYTRSYSAPRKYHLDLVNKIATEVWNYPNGMSVRSSFRSGVFEDAALNYLVHYDQLSTLRILGLSASGEKVFDYQFPGAGFRSMPVHWEKLVFP